MKLRRDILLFGTLAVVALVAGWWLLANRPGAAVEAFTNGAKARADAAKLRPIASEAFRATLCAAGPCVLVEAGGLTFVIGAGEGAAEGLTSRGLMRNDLDAVVLADLSVDSIAGLPALARASRMAGRTEPLLVYGPAGIVPVIDGMNLALSGDDTARLAVGLEKEDQGLEGVVVFDSGVVAIRAFGGQGRGESRVYRVDFEGKSLVITGCTSRSDQIVAAARGTQAISGIIMPGSSTLVPDDRAPCLDAKAALEAGRQARLSAILVSPARPSVVIPGAMAAWKEIVAAEKVAGATVGGPGSVLDLSGKEPVLRPAG